VQPGIIRAAIYQAFIDAIDRIKEKLEVKVEE